jgi:hypothetical protein
MISGPEMFPANDIAKNRNDVDSMKSPWIYIFFLIILSEEKSNASCIKPTIKKVKILRKMTKLTCDCINFPFGKRTTKIYIEDACAV